MARRPDAVVSRIASPFPANAPFLLKIGRLRIAGDGAAGAGDHGPPGPAWRTGAGCDGSTGLCATRQQNNDGHKPSEARHGHDPSERDV